MRAYEANRSLISKERVNIRCFTQAKKRFLNKKISATKYNYALDQNVQNFGCYECYIQLQKNDDVIIMNKRIIENPKYVLEQDPLEVQRIREEHAEEE